MKIIVRKRPNKSKEVKWTNGKYYAIKDLIKFNDNNLSADGLRHRVENAIRKKTKRSIESCVLDPQVSNGCHVNLNNVPLPDMNFMNTLTLFGGCK